MSAKCSESVLVVSPCSAKKRFPNGPCATFEELADETGRRSAFERLDEFRLPATEMYTGQHHRSVLRSMNTMRSSLPASQIDLAIISAGFGLIDENDDIVPYEATFSHLTREAALARARQLGIREHLIARCKRYEWVFVLLSEAYLTPLEAPFEAGMNEVYFAPMEPYLGDGAIKVPAGRNEADALSVAPRMVRAAQFERFVSFVSRCGFQAAIDEVSVLVTEARTSAEPQLALLK